MKVPIVRIQHLKRPETFVQKYSFVLDFADKQCQNESVVGGKGYSLATLTSIITNDVRYLVCYDVRLFKHREIYHDENINFVFYRSLWYPEAFV